MSLVDAESSHRRHNPLLDEWVLVSPNRLRRPWAGQVEPSEERSALAYDADCFLCPGNARASGQRNPDYGTTFAKSWHQVFFLDPEGNVVEVHQLEEGD